jgi:hypothetical protein
MFFSIRSQAAREERETLCDPTAPTQKNNQQQPGDAAHAEFQKASLRTSTAPPQPRRKTSLY